MIVIAGWISMPKSTPQQVGAASLSSEATHVELNSEQTEVFNVMQTHCANCHSATPTDDIFVVAPLGVMFDNWQQIEQRAAIINHRAVVTKDMPMLNRTGMSEGERQILAKWYQAKVQK